MTRIFTACLLALLAAPSLANSCDKDCQLTQAKAYFEALDKVARRGSTAADIDALLNGMHDEVRYLHLEYDANFDKASWRSAFLRQLKLGNYQNGPENRIEILNAIHGKRHLAVEYSHGLVDAKGQWQPGTPYMALFAFEGDKITEIKELW